MWPFYLFILFSHVYFYVYGFHLGVYTALVLSPFLVFREKQAVKYDDDDSEDIQEMLREFDTNMEKLHANINDLRFESQTLSKDEQAEEFAAAGAPTVTI